MTKEQYEKISAPYRTNPKGMRFIQWADRVMTCVIYMAYPMLLCILFYEKNWVECIKCIVIPAVSFVAVSLFRQIYSAPRPYELLDIQPLIHKDTIGRSFPSRHVFSVFMIGMTYLYIYPSVGILAGIIGVLMGYVRVVGGVHFPKDVFAGAVIGIICGLVYYVI